MRKQRRMVCCGRNERLAFMYDMQSELNRSDLNRWALNNFIESPDELDGLSF